MTDSLTPHSYFYGVKELDLLTRIASAPGDMSLMADPQLLAYMKAKSILPEGITVSTLGAERSPDAEVGAGPITVLSLTEEAKEVERLRFNYPGKRIYGFVRDWALACSLGLNHPDQLDQLEKESAPSRVYVILCTARSGSSWLCSLLKQTGVMGHPKEHLRPPVIHMARHRSVFGDSFKKWLSLTPRAFAVGDIFGTKIIDNFVHELQPHLTASETEDIKARFDDALIIHLERLDKVEQSVSEFLARSSNIWHLRGNRSPSKHRDILETIPYDRERLLSIHQRFVSHEELIRETIKPFKPQIHHLTYEGLVQSPESEARKILKRVTGSSHLEIEITQTRYEKMANDINAAFTSRLKDDL